MASEQGASVALGRADPGWADPGRADPRAQGAAKLRTATGAGSPVGGDGYGDSAATRGGGWRLRKGSWGRKRRGAGEPEDAAGGRGGDAMGEGRRCHGTGGGEKGDLGGECGRMSWPGVFDRMGENICREKFQDGVAWRVGEKKGGGVLCWVLAEERKGKDRKNGGK